MLAPGVPEGDGTSGSAANMLEIARRLLEAQRVDPYAAPGQPHQHRVGGFGELTTVTSAGITETRVVERPTSWNAHSGLATAGSLALP
jgi:hypothetical protein